MRLAKTNVSAGTFICAANDAPFFCEGETNVSAGTVDEMLGEQDRLFVKLCHWQDAFSSSTRGVDYRAQDMPVFTELQRSIKRAINIVTAFKQTVTTLLNRHRASLLEAINCALPQNVADFVESMKRRIEKAQPAAIMHPNAAAMCTFVCLVVCAIKKQMNRRMGLRGQRETNVSAGTFICCANEPPVREKLTFLQVQFATTSRYLYVCMPPKSDLRMLAHRERGAKE